MNFKKKVIESIGFNGNPSEFRIAVAMSGGVDSSVTAALLTECGYNVFGVSMHLYEEKVMVNNRKTCCAGIDINDAKKVCDKLGIGHFILNYSSRFNDQVISDFTDSYLKGETPIPCVKCNQTVKFVDMLNFSKKMGAVALATGHYIRRDIKDGKPSLYRANDLSKDQSYFLFATTFEQLSYLRFPLGDFTKSTIRDLARYFDLNVAEKPDSQDICFVPNGDYSSVIKRFRPESFKKGRILDLTGKQIGEHEGIINYTIGQRRGIKISSNKPLYVVNINADNNTVIVGHKENLEINMIDLRELNILATKKELEKIINIKVRSTGKLLKANVNVKNDLAKVEILDKETGISPGQACVFYSKDEVGDKLLGGGWINKTFNKNLST